MPDATADGTRSLYLKITSAVSLTVTRTVTLAPNTVSKVWIIENATTGSQIITIAQGSGATVNVPNGSKLMIVTDGAGGGAAVFNANPTTTAGTVTSVGGTGTVNGITLTGTVTSSGNLTLGGTLANVDLTSQVTGTLPVANGGTGITSFGTGVATALGTAINTSGGYVTQSSTLNANNVLLGGGSATAVSSSNLLATAAAVTSGTYIQSIGYADTVVALGNTSTAINLDVVSGGVFTATLTGNATITLRFPVATGASSFTLILLNDATPDRTVAFAGGSFKFPGGASTLSRTTTANAIDIWVFFTPDGGTTYYGNIAMKNMIA
jgi:hypothetical protein